jgi:hypothetical protein
LSSKSDMKNKAARATATMTSGSVKPCLEVFALIRMRLFINSMEIIALAMPVWPFPNKGQQVIKPAFMLRERFDASN